MSKVQVTSLQSQNSKHCGKTTGNRKKKSIQIRYTHYTSNTRVQRERERERCREIEREGITVYTPTHVNYN
jgi:hypothetical protein